MGRDWAGYSHEDLDTGFGEVLPSDSARFAVDLLGHLVLLDAGSRSLSCCFDEESHRGLVLEGCWFLGEFGSDKEKMKEEGSSCFSVGLPKGFDDHLTPFVDKMGFPLGCWAQFDSGQMNLAARFDLVDLEKKANCDSGRFAFVALGLEK